MQYACNAFNKKCEVDFICVGVYLLSFVNNDQYEENVLFAFSVIDSVNEQYAQDNVKVSIIGDSNFDEQRLSSCNRLRNVV